MTDDLPEPLVPPEVDLRDFPFVPIDVARLFNSQFHARANDAEWRAGVTLWLKSFHQVPAASLPDDDIALCRLAELGRDMRTWRKLRGMALYGWVKCSDGLLYHPVVAEKATQAWERKKAQRDRTEKARQARLSQRPPQTPERSVTEDVTGSKREGQGQGIGTESHSDPTGRAPAAPPAVGEIALSGLSPPDGDWSKLVFRQGLAWLAQVAGKPPDKLRSFVGQCLKLAGNDHKRVFELLARAQSEAIAEPQAWLTATLKGGSAQTNFADFDKQIDALSAQHGGGRA